MEELFLNKELSLIAKEKGFDEPCFGYYVNDIGLHLGFRFNYPDHNRSSIAKITYGNEDFVFAPLYQQIIDWFNNKGVDIEKPKPTTLGYLPHIYQSESCKWQGDYYDTKYKAYDKAIEEAFKLIP